MPTQIHIKRIPEWRYSYVIILRIFGYDRKTTDINEMYPMRFWKVAGRFDTREEAQAWLRETKKKSQYKKMTGRTIKKIYDRGKNEFALLTTGGNEWVWDIRAKKEGKL